MSRLAWFYTGDKGKSPSVLAGYGLKQLFKFEEKFNFNHSILLFCLMKTEIVTAKYEQITKASIKFQNLPSLRNWKSQYIVKEEKL